MKTAITFEVDADSLARQSDEHLAQLWHIGQANPAPFGDATACEFAEHVGREIIKRWLAGVAPALCSHQSRHVAQEVPEGRVDDAMRRAVRSFHIAF